MSVAQKSKLSVSLTCVSGFILLQKRKTRFTRTLSGSFDLHDSSLDSLLPDLSRVSCCIFLCFHRSSSSVMHSPVRVVVHTDLPGHIIEIFILSL